MFYKTADYTDKECRTFILAWWQACPLWKLYPLQILKKRLSRIAVRPVELDSGGRELLSDIKISMPMEETTQADIDPNVIDFGYREFQEREELKGHLGNACFRSLARHPGRVIMVDRSTGRKELSAGKILAVSLALSRKWKKTIPGKRVGIVFPPGIGGTLTNLALVLCGKIPTNLNFTMGPATIEASMKQAGIETVLTTEAVKKKLPNFPWAEDTRDLLLELASLSKAEILGLLAAVWICPSGWLVRLFNIPQKGDNEEAGLLFSSGSTGEPKGVALSHRNIIGNCRQIDATHLLPRTETILGCLPIFHSFGFNTALWLPLLSGVKVVTLPSPLEAKRIAKTIAEEKATVLFGTPTFYRPYFKRIDAAQLRSLKFVVGGAEKTPAGFGGKWEDQFGSRYLEGYGLTETSPVVSINLPGRSRVKGPYEGRVGNRTGSVGRLMPGIAARIVDPQSGQQLPVTEIGILHVKGPNVFSGYLNDPERSAKVFQDGWFVTGDLARFDEEGFLFIEGRITRFSKIGGEMVPHGTIENHIVTAFDLEESERPMVAVTGIADPAKGETLVLLSAIEISSAVLRERLKWAGLPNLWIPRIIKEVEEIPCLATGKLDLKGVERLALDR